MNYLRTYCNLVRKAEKRGYNKKVSKELGIYVEGHHIFPRSIYGQTSSGNKRIVYLTAREHYIAHSLLEKAFIKRYGRKNPKTIKMTHAFWKMNHQKKKGQVYYCNSYLYEAVKQRIGDNIRKRCLGVKQSQELVNKKRKIHSVYEYSIKDPNGKEYKTNSLKQFCKQYDLHGPTMCYVSLGKRNHYKGWTVKVINVINPHLIMKEEQKSLLRKCRLKTYYFLSPENKVIVVKDINKHCEKHQLSKRQMQRVHNLKLKEHRGWRLPR